MSKGNMYKELKDLKLRENNLSELQKGAGKTNFSKNEISSSDMFAWISIEQLLIEDQYLSYDNFIDIYTDQTDDGGIDFITDQNQLIQVKESLLNENELIACITKISDSINLLVNKEKNNLCNDVKIKFEEKINSEEKIDIIIICNDIHKSSNSKSLQEFIDWHKHKNSRIGEVLIHTYKDVLDKFDGNKSQLTYSFKVHNSILFNQNPNLNDLEGFIINISAFELFQMYEKFGEKLFDKNVRGFIPGNGTTNPGVVNTGIKRTLEDDPDIFWFANNGIVILASSYLFSNNEITIDNFSIINGCQTVSNIFFLLNEIEDRTRYVNIPVVCKIVKIPYSKNNKFLKTGNLKIDEQSFDKFIIKTTNSQKQLQSWTFFFEEPVIKKVHSYLIGKGYYLKIKDGNIPNNESPKKYKKVIKLPDYTQVAKSALNFVPGLSMQRKNKLFQNDMEWIKTFVLMENEKVHNAIIPLKVLEQFEELLTLDYNEQQIKNLKKGKQYFCSLFSFLLLEPNSQSELLNKTNAMQEISDYNLIWDMNKKINLTENKTKNLVNKLLDYVSKKEQKDLYKESNFIDFLKENRDL